MCRAGLRDCLPDVRKTIERKDEARKSELPDLTHRNKLFAVFGSIENKYK